MVADDNERSPAGEGVVPMMGQYFDPAQIGGMGLERFYAKLGWREIGRWPGALRLAPDDDRDEILMILTPL